MVIILSRMSQANESKNGTDIFLGSIIEKKTNLIPIDPAFKNKTNPLVISFLGKFIK